MPAGRGGGSGTYAAAGAITSSNASDTKWP
jgi:hypothetical protein